MVVLWDASEERAQRTAVNGAFKPLHVDHDGKLERRFMCTPPFAGVPYQVVDEDVSDDGRVLTIYAVVQLV